MKTYLPLTYLDLLLQIFYGINNNLNFISKNPQSKETNSSGLPQMEVDHVNTTVVITINDMNDNSPVFSSDHHNSSVSEEISGILLKFVEAISVSDADKDVRIRHILLRNTKIR